MARTASSPETAPTEGLVPVRELGQRMSPGADPIYWLDRVRAKISQTWDSRPAVSARDAAKALAAYREAIEANEARHTAYAQYLKDREVERRRIGEAAFREAAEKAFAAQRGIGHEINRAGHGGWAVGAFPISQIADPAVRRAGNDAAWEAQRKFDRKGPKTFEEFK